MGLGGPGGYLVLVGGPAEQWRDVATLIPGVGLVAVNPPGSVADEPGISVIRSGRLPLKAHSMRGVVLGAPYGGDARWVEEAARVLLPGLRVVGEGPDPSAETIDLMASADGVWVGTYDGRRQGQRLAGAVPSDGGVRQCAQGDSARSVYRRRSPPDGALRRSAA